MKNALIFDNKGETFDRYTIIDKVTGDIFGCSENPYVGFGQYCGNVTYGSNLCLNEAFKLFLKDTSNLGQMVDFRFLNDNVKLFIKERITK